MQVKSKIELKFKTSKDAKIIYKTLEVDNENFLKSHLKDNTLVYETNNNSLITIKSSSYILR